MSGWGYERTATIYWVGHAVTWRNGSRICIRNSRGRACDATLFDKIHWLLERWLINYLTDSVVAGLLSGTAAGSSARRSCPGASPSQVLVAHMLQVNDMFCLLLLSFRTSNANQCELRLAAPSAAASASCDARAQLLLGRCPGLTARRSLTNRPRNGRMHCKMCMHQKNSVPAAQSAALSTTHDVQPKLRGLSSWLCCLLHSHGALSTTQVVQPKLQGLSSWLCCLPQSYSSAELNCCDVSITCLPAQLW
jgi:hypothetical protein